MLDELKMEQGDVAEYVKNRQTSSPKELFLTSKTFSDALQKATGLTEDIHEIDGKMCISAKNTKLIFALGITEKNPLQIYIK